MKEDKKTTCDFEGCSRVVYSDLKQCVLHCDKDIDSSKLKILSALFPEALIEYILESKNFKKLIDDHNFAKDLLETYFKGNTGNVSGINPEEVKCLVIFNNIKFPVRVFPEKPFNGNIDYLEILKKLHSVSFISCDFWEGTFNNLSIPYYFHNCNFFNNWEIKETGLLEDSKTLYSNCFFYKHTKIIPNSGGCINSPLFVSCEFKETLNLQNTRFRAQVFFENIYPGKIKNIHITNCEFDKRFTLNGFNNVINHVNIKNSTFKSKVNLKNNHIIKEIYLNDSNFEDIFDSYGSNFHQFNTHKCIFQDYIGFEHSEFGQENKTNKEQIATFLYTTFESISNFRNTKFHNGLDIENSNFKETPNFLNSGVNPENTNRETFRIIKNSFDSVGNNIEANRFFALEMSKYKDELLKSKNKDDKQKLFVFKWNKRFSNFGQSYRRPIYWLLGLLIPLYLLKLGKDCNLLYKIYPPLNNIIECISKHFNGVAQTFLPFERFLIEGMEFISLCFYIVFVILIWQIIVAVKRHTKR